MKSFFLTTTTTTTQYCYGCHYNNFNKNKRRKGHDQQLECFFFIVLQFYFFFSSKTHAFVDHKKMKYLLFFRSLQYRSRLNPLSVILKSISLFKTEPFWVKFVLKIWWSFFFVAEMRFCFCQQKIWQQKSMLTFNSCDMLLVHKGRLGFFA